MRTTDPHGVENSTPQRDVTRDGAGQRVRVTRIEPAHLAGDLGVVLRRVELGDGADAGASGDEALPRRLIADPERGDHPHSGDDDAALGHGFGGEV